MNNSGNERVGFTRKTCARVHVFCLNIKKQKKWTRPQPHSLLVCKKSDVLPQVVLFLKFLCTHQMHCDRIIYMNNCYHLNMYFLFYDGNSHFEKGGKSIL